MDLTQKPYLGAQINWGHSLAEDMIGCWIMNEGSGAIIRDHAIGNDMDTVNLTPDWVPGGISCPTNYESFYRNSNIVDDRFAWGTGPFTFATRLKVVNNANYQYLLSLRSVDPGFALYPSGGTYFPYVYDGGVNGFTSITISYGETSSLVISRESTGASKCHGYKNGILGESITYSSSIAGALSQIVIGNSNPTASDYECAGVIYYIYLWDRALTADEALWLHYEPYAIFEPEMPVWMYYTEAAGGADDLLLLRGNLRGNLQELSGGLV